MMYNDPDDGTPLWQHILVILLILGVFIAITAVDPVR